MNKYFAIGLVSICFFKESKAQLSVADIKQKYAAYQAVWAKTKLHLVLNQEKYLPGDTLFLKAYFLKEDFTGVPGKQLVNVNLVGTQGESIKELKFQVNEGIGQSQMIIPNTLPSGIYYLTAHNDWMRNFDPAFIFKKKIFIVKKNEVVEVKQPFLQVAVEGGNLISDIPNRIGIYTHRTGTTVQISNGVGQEIGRTMTDSSGTASLLFTPVFNEKYMARIEHDTIYYELPVARKEGVVLQVLPSSIDETIKIRWRSSAPYQDELFVVITARGTIQFSATVKHAQIDSMEVKSSDLPHGLAHISMLDASGNSIVSRNFYNHYENEVMADIQPDQGEYTTRDKIKLNLSVRDRDGKPLHGEFSIRALNSNVFESKPPGLFSDEITLPEGPIPFQIDRNQKHWQSSLDNFLIATTKALPWSMILANQPAAPPHPVTNVIEKRGKVYFADSDTPLPDFSQISFYLQHNKSYLQTFTTDHGAVGFTLPQFFGDDEFFYVAKVLKQDDVTPVKVIWEEVSIPLPKAPVANEPERPDTYAAFMTRKRLIDQSYGIHGHLNDSINTRNGERKDPWEADISINVEDYILFATLPELIKEVVPAMYYRKTNKGEVVRIDLPEPFQATTSPLYIIDGIATRNTAFFLSLKPSDIKTIKVINTRAKLSLAGLLGRYGIVMVDTREGNVREPLDSDSKRLKGLDIPISLNMHNRPAANASTPDFRSTIYWNPSVMTDANGKAIIEFYCSDDIGNVTIIMDGFAKGAQPFSIRKDINVVLSPAKN